MSEGYGHLRDSARYLPSTLIGNWNEDRELRRSILKDLLAKKATGSLRLDAYAQRMAVALAETELTKVVDDPYIHFGDVLQLVHLDTGSVLSVDVNDRDVRPGEEACAATAAPEVRAPCARNTFILTKYHPAKTSPFEADYADDVLHYGQKVRLVANPAASGDVLDAAGGLKPLCLFSKPVSITHFAKYCRNQLVGFTTRDTFDTVWQVVTPDPTQRTVSEGVEVAAGAPILLLHCATQKPLLVENQKYPNEFGNEWELSARQSTSQGLKLAMEQTTKGIVRGSIPKGEKSENYWIFITGSKVASLPPAQTLNPEVDSLLSSMVQELAGKPGGLAMLERKLITHESQTCELPADDLLLLLRQVGSSIPESDVQVLTAFFATHKKGVVDVAGLLKAVRQLASALP